MTDANDPSTYREPPTCEGSVAITGPYLFFVFSADRPLTESTRHSLADVDIATIGRGKERSAIRKVYKDERYLYITVPDPWMSSSHVRLGKSLGGWGVRDESSSNGTFINGVATTNASLVHGDVIELGHSFFLYYEGLPVLADASPGPAARPDGAHPVGMNTLSPDLARAFGDLERVAHSNVSVLLQGASGTGKELAARAEHAFSKRPGGWVAVNCGALPDTLVEAELFGYVKGAFSGAVKDHPGLIRTADRGTLFLDEISHLSGRAQAALLRALQEREVLPVGATKPIPVDFRLVSATNRDIDELVESGGFAEDLMARITGFTLWLPSLRDCRYDLGVIVGSLLRRLRGPSAMDISFSKEAVRALLAYHWPLNIRELEKCLERAIALADGTLIKPEHFPRDIAAARFTAPSPPTAPRALVSAVRPSLEEIIARFMKVRSGDAPAVTFRPSREELIVLLEAYQGNVSAIARALNTTRVQIRRWLAYYELDAEAYRPR